MRQQQVGLQHSFKLLCGLFCVGLVGWFFFDLCVASLFGVCVAVSCQGCVPAKQMLPLISSGSFVLGEDHPRSPNHEYVSPAPSSTKQASKQAQLGFLTPKDNRQKKPPQENHKKEITSRKETTRENHLRNPSDEETTSKQPKANHQQEPPKPTRAVDSLKLAGWNKEPLSCCACAMFLWFYGACVWSAKVLPRKG